MLNGGSGASTSTATMTTNAIATLSIRAARGATVTFCATMSGAPSEQAGRADQQHDRHDDEDHGVRRLRKEHLGEPLDDAEAEAREDRAEDRAHAADHHHGEHHDDQLAAHLRAHSVD